jgi:tagatose 6-phosphate kinase
MIRERCRAAFSVATVVVISGVMPDGLESAAIVELIGLARDAGRPCIVDTSGPALRTALEHGATLVKPNVDELTDLTGDLDPIRAATGLARTHHAVVVVSLGADGAVAVTDSGSWRARPRQAIRGNPTGAGDALVAGLARGIGRGRPWPDTLADSVALAAAAVRSPVAGEVDLRYYQQELAGVTTQPIGLHS